MAKKRSSTGSKPSKRAKRSKRKWKDVNFQRLDAWRAARKISKKKMAEMLGVTNSTYHNWAREIAVATPNTQSRILRVITGNGVAEAAKSGESNGATLRPSVMAATGEIVRSYLETKPSGMTIDKLVRLVRDVRAALS